MKRIAPLVFASVLLSACATTKNVTFVQPTLEKMIATAVLTPEQGNSPEMDANVREAFISQGITLLARLPAGTRKTADVDAIITYVDVWRWDLFMYLQTLTINIFDATSRNLLGTARWDDSPLHGFRDPKVIVHDLLAEMFTKLRQANPKGSARQSE